MPSALEALYALDAEAQAVLMNKLRNSKLEHLSPAEVALGLQMDREVKQLAHLPPGEVPPSLQNLQRMMQSPLPAALRSGAPPQEYLATREKIYLEQLEEVLDKCPPIKALQQQANALLRPNIFDIPAMLNAISKHLGRPPQFIMLELYLPSEAHMLGQLLELQASKPAVHMQLLKVLIQACTVMHAPHPRNCTCLLCAHVAKVMTLAAASSQQGSSGASSSSS